MESNRDEAERCIEIAKGSVREGKLDRAEKFLRKAELLFPTPAAADLLASVLAKAASGSSTPTTAQPEADDGPSASQHHQQQRRTSPGRRSAPTRVEPDYTVAQLEVVKKIKK